MPEPASWMLVAGLLSIVGFLIPMVWLRSRPRTYRLLAGLGVASLIWGVAPVLGGRGISPLPVIVAVVASGFLILVELTTDEDFDE